MGEIKREGKETRECGKKLKLRNGGFYLWTGSNLMVSWCAGRNYRDQKRVSHQSCFAKNYNWSFLCCCCSCVHVPWMRYLPAWLGSHVCTQDMRGQRVALPDRSVRDALGIHTGHHWNLRYSIDSYSSIRSGCTSQTTMEERRWSQAKAWVIQICYC